MSIAHGSQQKRNMKKTLLLTLALLLSAATFAQSRSTLISESFNSKSLPSGWSIKGGGNKNWSVTATDKAGGSPNELDFYWDPVFEGISRMTTPAINLTGISSIIVSFKHYFDYYPYYNNTCTLGIATSSDNGTTWNTGWSQAYNETGRYVVNEVIETADMGKENVLVCIYFEGSTNDINSWQFDDILIFKQEEIDAELSSININEILGNGENVISFSVRNLGKSTINTFKAKYYIEGEDNFITETFTTNIETYESEQFTFKTPLYVTIGKQKLNVEITSVNDNTDQFTDNNVKVKDIDVKLGVCQRIPMIEHFSSSTCYPCIYTNQGMDTLTAKNPGKYTYVKYPMNGPGTGDPYYISDCNTRRVYYNVNNVPTIFLDGTLSEDPLPQEKLDNRYNTTSFINIRGSFNVNEADSTITVVADFFSYSDIKNVSAYISVNEKVTTKNVGVNGETEFHHILMKLLGSASGTKITVNAGEYHRLEFTHDMTSTNMEELNDLEVALWLQNSSTKEIYNSRFAYGYTDHVYPIENLNITTVGEDPVMKLTWDAPTGNTPESYNILVDGKLVVTNVKALTYTDEASAWKVYDGLTHYVEVVAVYENGMTSVGTVGKISEVVNVNEIEESRCSIYPNPANDRLYIEIQTLTPTQTQTQTLTQTLTVEIYDIYGRSQKLSAISGQLSVIDLSELNAGIYIIKINTKEGNIVKQFIKQ